MLDLLLMAVQVFAAGKLGQHWKNSQEISYLLASGLFWIMTAAISDQLGKSQGNPIPGSVAMHAIVHFAFGTLTALMFGLLDLMISSRNKTPKN